MGCQEGYTGKVVPGGEKPRGETGSLFLVGKDWTRHWLGLWRLDEDDFRRRRALFRGLATCCLIGGGYAKRCIGINRTEIIERKIEIARLEGLVPVSMTPMASFTLPVPDGLDVAAPCVLVSLDQQPLNATALRKLLARVTKCMTVFRILRLGRHAANIWGCPVDFLRGTLAPSGVIPSLRSPFLAVFTEV